MINIGHCICSLFWHNDCYSLTSLGDIPARKNVSYSFGWTKYYLKTLIFFLHSRLWVRVWVFSDRILLNLMVVSVCWCNAQEALRNGLFLYTKIINKGHKCPALKFLAYYCTWNNYWVKKTQKLSFTNQQIGLDFMSASSLLLIMLCILPI